MPEWVAWGCLKFSSWWIHCQPILDHSNSADHLANPGETGTTPLNSTSCSGESIPNGVSSPDSSKSSGSDSSQKATTVPSLFEEDVEFVGVELRVPRRPWNMLLKKGLSVKLLR